MKVAVICNLPPPAGGAEVLARDIILSLAKNNVEVSVITQDEFAIEIVKGKGVKTYAFDAKQQSKLGAKGVKIYPVFKSVLAGKKNRDGFKSINEGFANQLEKILKEVQPDIVHCHFTTGQLKEVSKVTQELDLPLVVTLHGMTNLIPQYDSFVRGGWSPENILNLLQKSHHNVVVSKPMYNYCREHGLANVTRIPGGINMEYFSPEYNTANEGIVYVGKYNQYKGLKEVCKAYLMVADKIDDPLFLIGRGTTKEIFAETAFDLDPLSQIKMKELIDQGRVLLLGEITPEEVRYFYRRARIFALPSLTEGLPISMLEALSCGLPVIASSVGSIPDVIEHGQNGYLIPKGQVAELARYIIEIIHGEKKEYKDVCRNSVRQYEISLLTLQYKNLFQDIMRRRVLDGENCLSLQ